MERHEIHNRIGHLMDHEHLTQDQMAQRLGVSRELIKHWCAGTRNIKAGDITKIADTFGVSCDWLLGKRPLENPTSDAELGTFCQQTGLSNDAVYVLKYLNGIVDAEMQLHKQLEDCNGNVVQFYGTYGGTDSDAVLYNRKTIAFLNMVLESLKEGAVLDPEGQLKRIPNLFRSMAEYINVNDAEINGTIGESTGNIITVNTAGNGSMPWICTVAELYLSTLKEIIFHCLDFYKKEG